MVAVYTANSVPIMLTVIMVGVVPKCWASGPMMAKPVTVAASQRRLITSRNPSASSRRNDRRLVGLGAGAGRSRIRNAALIRKVAASMAMADPGLDAAISTPAMSGPAIMDAFRDR